MAIWEMKNLNKSWIAFPVAVAGESADEGQCSEQYWVSFERMCLNAMDLVVVVAAVSYQKNYL